MMRRLDVEKRRVRASQSSQPILPYHPATDRSHTHPRITGAQPEANMRSWQTAGFLNMNHPSEEISALAPADPNEESREFPSLHTIRRFQAAVTKMESISGATSEIASRCRALIVNTEINSSYAPERDTGFALIASELQSVAQCSIFAVDETARAIGQLMDGGSTPGASRHSFALTLAEISDKVRDLHHRAGEIIHATKELSLAFARSNPANRDIWVQAVALRKACGNLIELNHELAKSTQLRAH